MRTEDSSTLRRIRAADRRKRKLRRVVMRTCGACLAAHVKPEDCVKTKGSVRCTECDKTNRRCDLAPPGREYEKAQDVVEKLDEDIWEVRTKLARLERQRKFHLRKLKEMGDTEAQNILELEADECSEEPPPPDPFSPSTFPVDLDWTQFSVPETVAVDPGSSQGS